MEKQTEKFRKMKEMADAQKLLMAVKKYGDIQVVSGHANVNSVDELRGMADTLMEKLENGLVVLNTVIDGKVNFVVKASKGAVDEGVHAGKIVKEMAKLVGGGGGGRPDMATAGGKIPDKIPDAMEKAHEMIEEIAEKK